MKKVLLTLLAVIVILAALGGAGYAGYRIGYTHGTTNSGDFPFIGRGERMHPNFMPNFDRDFGFHMQPYRSPMMGRGDFGMSFFSPFRLLWNVAVLALVIWFVYWLFTKSGWRITRETGREAQAAPSDTEG